MTLESLDVGIDHDPELEQAAPREGSVEIRDRKSVV